MYNQFLTSDTYKNDFEYLNTSEIIDFRLQQCLILQKLLSATVLNSIFGE